MQRNICQSLQLTGITLFLVISWLQLIEAWEVQQVPNSYTKFGISLYWRDPSLYMADLKNAQFKRLDTSTNQMYMCQIENENELTFILPTSNADNLFVVDIGHYVGDLEWDGFSSVCPVRRRLFQVETDDRRDKPSCLIDGRCDAKGRLFAGSGNCKGDYSNLRHYFYRYSNGRLDTIGDHLNVSNGIAWNERRKELYHLDSGANTITRYQYDADSGTPTNPEVVFKLDSPSYPMNFLNVYNMAGLTIDTDENVYVTVFGGNVLKISTDTWQILDQYEIPCPYTVFLTFGGPNLDILYVSTTSTFFGDIDLPDSCGHAFQIINTGAKGLPENSCAIN